MLPTTPIFNPLTLFLVLPTEKPKKKVTNAKLIDGNPKTEEIETNFDANQWCQYPIKEKVSKNPFCQIWGQELKQNQNNNFYDDSPTRNVFSYFCCSVTNMTNVVIYQCLGWYL